MPATLTSECLTWWPAMQVDAASRRLQPCGEKQICDGPLQTLEWAPNSERLAALADSKRPQGSTNIVLCTVADGQISHQRSVGVKQGSTAAIAWSVDARALFTCGPDEHLV